MTKEYTQFGVQLDADLASHLGGGCTACKQYDADKPATIAMCCLEGSVLVKRYLAGIAPKKQSAPRSQHYAPTAEVKRLTQYK